MTSLLCAAAPAIGLLVAARALQGVAGALLTPSSLAVIATTFQDKERGAAIGTWTAFGAIATFRAARGGELLALASWRWLFVINVPVVACCLTLIVGGPAPGALERPAPPGRPRRAGLCAAGSPAVFAMIEAPRLGLV